MSVKTISKSLIHPLICMEQGQNDWLNGCMAFLMNSIGENPGYDYWFFSGVTGDSFLQVYSSRPEEMALCYSHIMTEAALKAAFDACGYGYEDFVISSETSSRLEERVRRSIDRNIPVIARLEDVFHSFGMICGYDAEQFYCMTGEETAPVPCRYDRLIFLTEKKERPSLAGAYRNAVMRIPYLLNLPDASPYSFGKRAFFNWADSFQNGRFAGYSPADPIWYTHGTPGFSCWNMHGAYLCMLGTNACAADFLQKAWELNPELDFIERLIPLYHSQNRDGFSALVNMEGGFGLAPEVLLNAERMKPVCEAILTAGSYCDSILAVFREIGGGDFSSDNLR